MPATRHVDVIDLARVLLLFVIFVCHAVSYLPHVAYTFDEQLTGYALQLFFIISGFGCVLSALRRPPEPTAHYFKRKLKKFYPLHAFTYAVALVLMIIAARQTGEALDVGALVGQSVVNLPLLQSWSWSDDIIFSFNGVSWFLSSLAFCYLLAPWLARRLRRLSADGALVLAIAAAAASYVYAVWWDSAIGFALTCFTDVLPPFRFMEFSIGG